MPSCPCCSGQTCPCNTPGCPACGTIPCPCNSADCPCNTANCPCGTIACPCGTITCPWGTPLCPSPPPPPPPPPPVITPCCPLGLPETLHVTISNVAGCGCLAGTYTIVWDQTQWTNGTGNTACGTNSFIILFTCLGGSCNDFQLLIQCGGGSDTFTHPAPTSCVCDPNDPSFVYAGMSLSCHLLPCCCDGGTINATVTA